MTTVGLMPQVSLSLGERFFGCGDVVQEAGFMIEISESRVKKAGAHLFTALNLIADFVH